MSARHVEALADEPACTPGQCCRGYCLEGWHDLDRDTLAAYRVKIRAALASASSEDGAE